MKRYYNFAYMLIQIFYMLFICCTIFFIIGFGSLICMCFCAGVNIILFFLVSLFPHHIIATYYDEEKIKQRFLWKRKKIEFKNIKEIYIVGSNIYITSIKYNFSIEEQKNISSKVAYKMLKKEVLIMINTQEANFLKNISQEKIEIHILKNCIPKIIERYFCS